MAASQIDYSIIAELERIGWAYEFLGEDELKCICPFHEDHSPSCNVSISKRLFKCHVCPAKGDGITLLAKILKTTRRVAYEDLLQRYGGEDSKVVDATVVEKYHAAIWAAKPLLQQLYDRGVTNDMIREHRLGYESGRITIPIKNEAGVFVNVRKYMPGAAGAEKFKNIRGHGSMRLFMPEQLKYDSIVVCGGEIKAIVTAALLNPHNIGAISLTGGEGNWAIKFSEQLKGKARVWVLLDIDEAGQKASAARCAGLAGYAEWVGSVKLPLDAKKYPTGDVNDWIGREKATAEDLIALLKGTPPWKPPTFIDYSSNEKPRKLQMVDAVDAKHAGKRVRVKGLVSAMDQAPYVIPRKVVVQCDKSQVICALCPAFSLVPNAENVKEIDIPPESPGVLEMISTPKTAQRGAIMASLGIPSDCDIVSFSPTAWYNAEDVRVSPELNITNRAADRIMQPAVCIGHGLELNETYWFTGRMFPHPKTQQSTLLISSTKTAQDALSSYRLFDAENLRVFQPSEWTVEAVGNKLDRIYDDLESNVTRIYQRRAMHLAIDLAYHSALLFRFDGKVTKGWSEILIVGDSSQGKSETCIQLMQHYGLGEKVECKNASVAGLLGGLQQMGSKWFVTWGVIPTHDKRLVVLEELKGASTEVISKLTDMRSSGVAEIPKIEKRRTHARTRLIALSNPRSGHPIASYNFGIEAVRELIGGLEDVRRFDLALILSADEIDEKSLNVLMESRPIVEHWCSKDLSKKLILWAWTRGVDQVNFEEGTRQAILSESTRLCGLFSESIPLCDRGSMRLKIARLATALACRTFSASEDFEEVLVRPCHVHYVTCYIELLYSSNVHGYLGYSQALVVTQALQDSDMIRKKLFQVPFPRDFIEQLLNNNTVELRDIADWCGWTREMSIELLSLLVRKHALRRDGNSYRKTPQFIDLLKELLKDEKLLNSLRPEHIKEEY